MIRIGGICYGIAGEVAGPTGSVWTLLKGMNGERSNEEIVEYVLARHPGETRADVREALATLAASGYAQQSTSLSKQSAQKGGVLVDNDYSYPDT